MRFCIPGCRNSANRQGGCFVHEIEGFTLAALGRAEITWFNVEAELQQTGDSGVQLWSTDGVH